MSLCIGLFGTCGNTTFRQDLFVPTYEQNDMAYYNPQVEDWTPECAVEEANHLANDEILLFPITRETYGSGSLSEIGFSVLNAIKLDSRRDMVVMIDQELNEDLIETNVIAAKESLRARALVREHLKKLNYPNIYMVDDLETMLDLSMQLYISRVVMEEFRKYSLKEMAK